MYEFSFKNPLTVISFFATLELSVRKAFIVVLFLLLAFVTKADLISAQFQAPVINLPEINTTNQTNQIIIIFKDKPSVSSMLSVTDGNTNIVPEYGISAENSMVYTVRDGNISGTIESIKKNTNVSKVFPNYPIRLMNIPNDTHIVATPEPNKPRLQWNMFNLKLADTGKSAWDVSKGASSIVVAVIDSGVDSSHPDLSGKFSSLVDCVSGCREVTTMTDSLTAPHGTHVAGLVAASTNNSAGIAGSGYDTRIMMVKVMDTNGEVSIGDLINAVKWASDHGAKVINMSLGQIEENLDASAISTINDAVSYAWGKGVLLVAAAGNCSENVPHTGTKDKPDKCDYLDTSENLVHAKNSKYYPGASPNVLSVAALMPDNSLASYSEHNDASNTKIGNWISVAAPGGGCSSTNDAYNCVLSTIYTSGGDKYGYMAGTSQASPQVAGIAALMLALNPNMTNADVKAKIENTANKSIAGTVTNNGMVDALAAVSAVTPAVSVSPTVSTSVTPSPTPTGSSATPSPAVTGGATPTVSPPVNTPTPTITPYPTTGPARLPKIPPSPYPSPPYCGYTPPV